MKKLMLAASAASFLFLFSCNNETNSANDMANSSSDAAKDREVNAKIYHAIETGDVAIIDSVIAADAIDHGSLSGREVRGVDSIKADLAKIHLMFNNLKLELLNSATDGDITMDLVRLTGTCTMDAPEMGMMKGKAVDMTSVEVTKFKDGKAYEHWTYINPKDMASPAAPQTEKEPGKK